MSLFFPAKSFAAIIFNSGEGFATMQGGADDTSGFDYVGHFLVISAPVPEPENYVMLLAGLGLLLGFASRRGK